MMVLIRFLVVVGVVLAAVAVVVVVEATHASAAAAFCCRLPAAVHHQHRAGSGCYSRAVITTDGVDRFQCKPSLLQLGGYPEKVFIERCRRQGHTPPAPPPDVHRQHSKGEDAETDKVFVDDDGRRMRRDVIVGAGVWSAAVLLGVATSASSAPPYSFASESATTAHPTSSTTGVVAMNDAVVDDGAVNAPPASFESITIPLQYSSRLSAYLIQYGVGGNRFAAIVDTGSPFLVIPGGYCTSRGNDIIEDNNGKNMKNRTTAMTTRNRARYGCFQPQQSRPSGLPTTIERFDNNQGAVEWRVAPFSFVNAAPGSSMIGPREMVFGVLSESLMTGTGGVFFGLVRDTDTWIRPSFLSQTNVDRMVIDLRGTLEDSGNKTLTLYHTYAHRSAPAASLSIGGQEPQKPPPPGSRYSYIPLTRDLNRKYGDVVIHYTAQATAFSVNGHSVLPRLKDNHNNQRPMYVIFDTGVTGMVVSQELFDQRYLDARQRHEKSLWGDVTVTFATKMSSSSYNNNEDAGNNKKTRVMEEVTVSSPAVMSLSAHKPVTTPLGTRPWPKFKNAYLIVLGLAFLDGRRIEIDMNRDRLQLC